MASEVPRLAGSLGMTGIGAKGDAELPDTPEELAAEGVRLHFVEAMPGEGAGIGELPEHLSRLGIEAPDRVRLVAIAHG